MSSAKQNAKTASTKTQIVWRNVLMFIILHLIALNGLFYLCTLQLQPQTIFWFFFVGIIASQGITSGAHRLWAHRSYKAKLPLRILLCFLQTVALQNDVIEWSRDHRVHHKFTETDADPHNAKRGFFFSHMGWLMVRKHPDVIAKGSTVDVSDLKTDPVLRFQRKYYALLGPICCFVIPSLVPVWYWNEDVMVSFCVPGMLRYLISLHCTWLVNSAAHMWGMKPYDRYINPVENGTVSFLTFGEGWHNYHHTFPWDYKAAELDEYSGNLSTAFIDLMWKIGWAYDLKVVPKDVIKMRIMRTGSLSHRCLDQSQE